jgi:hypothetical protein
LEYPVQVSVTNSVEYEVKNAIKCIQAGFSRVAVICRNRNKLGKIQEGLAQAIAASQSASVSFYTPEEFLAKLFDWEAEDPAGAAIERGKPRKRKIALGSQVLTEAERNLREGTMLEQLRQAMKRQGATLA